MKRHACIVILAAVLSGCGGVLTSEEAPLREYWLMPDATLMAPEARLEGIALRVEIAAPKGMDRRELLHLEPTGQLREYAGARWTDDASSIVANYIELALEQAAGISSERDNRAGEVNLALELRSFYTRSTADTDEALLELVSRIRCGNETSARRVSLATPVRRETLAAVIAAHRLNLDVLSRGIVDQLVENCADKR